MLLSIHKCHFFLWIVFRLLGFSQINKQIILALPFCACSAITLPFSWHYYILYPTNTSDCLSFIVFCCKYKHAQWQSQQNVCSYQKLLAYDVRKNTYALRIAFEGTVEISLNVSLFLSGLRKNNFIVVPSTFTIYNSD